MTQGIAGLGFKGSGIVGIFLVAGFIMFVLNPNSGYVDLFLKGGFGIGLILALLGIFAVAKRVI